MGIIDRFYKLDTGARGVLLVLGAYIVTMGLAVFSILFAMIFLIDTHSCSAMGRALVTLWILLAVLFLTSIVVLGVVARKVIPSRAGCLTTVAAHVFAMLASYVVMAFGLLVAFNC